MAFESESRIWNEEKCCICLELLSNRDVVIFPCGHKCTHLTCFHKSEIGKCPLCNKSIDI